MTPMTVAAGESTEADHRAGLVTLVGRSNVGKSTLLNRLVGMKLAAVTDKPQTTRNRIVGIVTRPEAQAVFVDTPGIHAATTPLSARMVKVARQSLGDTDVAILVIDAAGGGARADREVAAEVGGSRSAVVAVTKNDLVTRAQLMVRCAEAAALLPACEVVPVSGRTGDNVERLLSVVIDRLPAGPALYPPEQVSEQSERFLASEIVREKIVDQTRDEIPYATAVLIDDYREEPSRNLLVIRATVIVERSTQKGILIGEHGRRIRDIGQAARLELEQAFGCRVFLDLHVKVRREWSKDPNVLREIGL